LFSTKKRRVDVFPSALPGGIYQPTEKGGGGGVLRQPTGGPPEIKVDGAQGLKLVGWECLGEGCFSNCSVWLQGY